MSACEGAGVSGSSETIKLFASDLAISQFEGIRSGASPFVQGL
jgi:hypothetical protein